MKKKFIFLVLVTIIVLTATGCFFNGDEQNSEPINLSKTQIKLNIDKYDYTGQAICPGFKIYQNNVAILDFTKGTHHEDLSVTYLNNINVGRATIKVEPKANSKNYIGSVSANFVIYPVNKIANDASSLVEYLSDSNNQKVSLGQDIVIPSDVNILLQNKVVLNTNGYTLTNNGSITIEGTLNINNANNRISKVENLGNFNFNNAKVSTLLNAGQNTIFHNKGKLTLFNSELKGNRHSSAYLFSDTPILDYDGNKLFVKKDSSPYFFYRRPLTEFEINFTEENIYTGEEIHPSFSIKNTEADGIYYIVNNCDVTYTNNINVGTASMKIVAKEYSKYFTGEITKQFEISKANITIDESKYNLLNNVLANENYNEVTLFGNYTKAINVPKNATLIIKGNNNIPTIVNNGTLKIVNTNVDDILLLNRLTNNGLLDITGTKLVVNSVIDGTGQVNLNNDLFLNTSGNISNIKLSTTKKVYYNNNNQVESVNLLSGELIKREQFLISNNLKINNNHIEYANQNIKMSYSFIKDGSNVLCPNDTYTLTNPSVMRNAGEYDFIIEFLPLSKQFYGLSEGIFYIDKTSIKLGSTDEIGTILDSNNYDNITIDNPTFMPVDKQYIVPKDTVINIGVNGALYNNTFIQDNLIKSSLVLLGKIKNDGIYCEIGDRNLSLRPDIDEDKDGLNIGIIENNGKVYFNEVTEGNKSRIRAYGAGYPKVGGTSFVRTTIGDSLMNVISSECTFVKKDGLADRANLLPDVSLSQNGKNLIKANDLMDRNSDFVIVGYNNRHITSQQNDTYAYITACYTSEKVFSKRKVDYTIKPGTTSVANFDELKKALNDSVSFRERKDYVCDWNEIIVTGDIQYTGAYKTSITVPSNVKLRFGNNKVNLYSTEKDMYYKNYVCSMYNFGTIYTSVKYYFDMEYYAKDKGKTIGEAYDLEDFKSYLRYDEIILMTDLTTDKDNKDIVIKTNGNQEYHGDHVFTIDLNGHTIKNLLIDCDGRSVKVIGDSLSRVNYLYLQGMRNDYEYGVTPHGIILENFSVDYLTYDSSYEERDTIKNNMTITTEEVHDVIKP